MPRVTLLHAPGGGKQSESGPHVHTPVYPHSWHTCSSHFPSFIPRTLSWAGLLVSCSDLVLVPSGLFWFWTESFLQFFFSLFFSFSFWDIQRLSSRNTQGCICLFLRSMKSIKVYLVRHCWCHCWCHFQQCFHTGLPLFETERRQQNLFTAWCPVGCGFSSLYSWEVFLKWMPCVLFFSIGEIWMPFCTC